MFEHPAGEAGGEAGAGVSEGGLAHPRHALLQLRSCCEGCAAVSNTSHLAGRVQQPGAEELSLEAALRPHVPGAARARQSAIISRHNKVKSVTFL